MLGDKFNLSWETISKLIFALLGVIPALVLLTNFLNSRSPQITVRNELAFPIRVYSGDSYQGIVSRYSKRTFRFYSDNAFPMAIRWESVRQKDSSGKAIGSFVTGTIALVDNHQEITITHTTGEIDYFMPVLTNESKASCKIYINDGLPSEQYAGFLLAGKHRVNVGYYKWYVNSNVTLYCNNDPHWWGDRHGNKGP